MNKFLYCFILILLLNQCLSDECDNTESSAACSDRTTKSTLNKCVETSVDPLRCAENKKTCAEASTLADADCSQLSTTEILCITGTSGCITPSTCDEVISDATPAICQRFEDSINNCEYKAANTENEENKKAHCKSSLKACTESLGDVKSGQETICSQRDKSKGAICYFDGKSACKEAKKCEDVELLTGKADLQGTCDNYNTDSPKQKCVADGNKCILKSYCKEGKQAEHECSYYGLETDNKICVPKEDSTTDCEELDPTEYETRLETEAENVCKKLKGDACTLTFAKTYFADCELSGESGSQTCASSGEYGTCDSAKALSEAKNEQCSKLVHSSDKYCIKGENGCLEVAMCESITGTKLTDAICKNFPAPSNYECVKGEGNQCNLVAKKTGGNNSSSQGLTLSFTMLILILVI